MKNLLLHILAHLGAPVESIYMRYSELYLEFITDEKTITVIEHITETPELF